MGDCLTIGAANDFLSKDSSRISGRIARSLSINNPYLSLVETDTFQSGISDVQRSVVQEAVAPVLSQANPQWNAFQCNTAPQSVQTGSTEYTYTPSSYFERGPKICVTQAYSAFKTAIKNSERSIIDHVDTLWCSWIRYQMFLLSATKATAYSGATSIEQILASGFQTNFVPGVTPDSPLSWTFLKFLMNHLHHALLARGEFMFGEGNNAHYRLISDADTIDSLRESQSVQLQAGVTGGFRDKYDDLYAFGFEGPYRGLAFGVDQSILRANGVNADGSVDFVEPFASAAASKGTKRVVSKSWLTAPYQISFLCAKGSFIREVPEELAGEGLTNFEKQFWGGDVRWHNQKDNDCNVLGNTGFHVYQLAAAMRPERPAFIIPILHTRCKSNFGLTSCTPQSYYASAL